MKSPNPHFPTFNVTRFLGRSARGALVLLPLFIAGCTECRRSGHGDSTQGTTSRMSTEELVSAAIDTIWGFVGDGTSMHLIELVSTDAADTMLLELEDDADHRATLTVGHEIGVAVQQQPDGQQIVLATFDADAFKP